MPRTRSTRPFPRLHTSPIYFPSSSPIPLFALHLHRLQPASRVQFRDACIAADDESVTGTSTASTVVTITNMPLPTESHCLSLYLPRSRSLSTRYLSIPSSTFIPYTSHTFLTRQPGPIFDARVTADDQSVPGTPLPQSPPTVRIRSTALTPPI